MNDKLVSDSPDVSGAVTLPLKERAMNNDNASFMKVYILVLNMN